jgi:hypothetical protein
MYVELKQPQYLQHEKLSVSEAGQVEVRHCAVIDPRVPVQSAPGFPKMNYFDSYQVA